MHKEDHPKGFPQDKDTTPWRLSQETGEEKTVTMKSLDLPYERCLPLSAEVTVCVCILTSHRLDRWTHWMFRKRNKIKIWMKTMRRYFIRYRRAAALPKWSQGDPRWLLDWWQQGDFPAPSRKPPCPLSIVMFSVDFIAPLLLEKHVAHGAQLNRTGISSFLSVTIRWKICCVTLFSKTFTKLKHIKLQQSTSR